MNNVKGRFALLEIDKYPTIDWGVHCIFQSNDKTVTEAMKLIKEDPTDGEGPISLEGTVLAGVMRRSSSSGRGRGGDGDP